MRMWPDASKDVLPPVIHLPIFLLLLLCGQPAIQPSICLSIHPSHPSSTDGIRGSDMGGRKKASNCKADQLTREFARGTLLHKSAGGGGGCHKGRVRCAGWSIRWGGCFCSQCTWRHWAGTTPLWGVSGVKAPADPSLTSLFFFASGKARTSMQWPGTGGRFQYTLLGDVWRMLWFGFRSRLLTLLVPSHKGENGAGGGGATTHHWVGEM